MKASARAFTDSPATRSHVPLLIGLVGPSGGGKTMSALRLAEGIRRVTGGDIYGIDTESRRMLHYADQFSFRYVEFGAPFGSLDYLAAVKHCVEKGAKVVIVDSLSHEHEGPGGLLDLQEQELDRLIKGDESKREKYNMLAWQKPKAARHAFIAGLLQLNANFIFCFRAREKTKPMRNRETGKTEVVKLGFMPIAGEEFLFEMTANCYLLPRSNGVPTWESEEVGERAMMKLPAYLSAAFVPGQPLSEQTGQRLAEWARGKIFDWSGPHAIPSEIFPAASESIAVPPTHLAENLMDPGSHATIVKGLGSNPPTAIRPTQTEIVHDYMSDHAYVWMAREHIAQETDVKALGAWWNSAEQKQARKDAKLGSASLAGLVQDVYRRKAELEANASS